MKKFAIGIIQSWAICFVFVTALRAQNNPNPSFEVTLEGKTASTNRVKAYYTEFTNTCPPLVRKYKQKIVEQTITYDHWADFNCDEYYFGHWSSVWNMSDTYIWDSLNSVSDGCTWTTTSEIHTNITGSGHNEDIICIPDDQSPGYPDTNRCSSTRDTTTGEWVGDPYCAPHESSYGNFITLYPSPNVQMISHVGNTNVNFHWDTYPPYCTDTNGVDTYEWSDITTTTYSAEYTTDDLLSGTDLEYPADWSGAGTASTSISPDELCGSATKAKYRFKVIAPVGEHFEINYLVHYQAGNYYTNWPEKIEGIGTGDVAYYPETPIEFLPPRTNRTSGGCTFAVGASKWITLEEECPGGCSSGSCGPSGPGPGSWNASLGSVSIRANLGQGGFGAESGHLTVARDTPNANLTTPAGLHYFGNLKDVELVKQSGQLRQVKAPQAFADIVTIDSTSYQIKFYIDSGSFNSTSGLYEPSGSPFSVGTIRQIDSTNHIQVVVENGVTTTNEFEWSDSDKGWTMTSGGGIRKESVSWNESTLVRTRTIKNESNQVIYKETKYYQDLTDWGLVLKKLVVDPDGSALTSQWIYYDNQSTDGTNYGSIKMVIQPSGFWKRYEYDSNNHVTNEVSQFLNAATNAAVNLCRVFEYNYSAIGGTDRAERRVEKLLGQEISRQYTLNYGWQTKTIQCQTPGTTDLNAADNLVTISTYTSDTNFPGKIQSVLNPDGTMQIYQYGTNDTYMTNIVMSGQPDTYKTNIVDGTISISVSGTVGQPVYHQSFDISSEIKLEEETYGSYDDFMRPLRTDYLGGTYTLISYACCGLDTSTDRDGTTTEYLYDPLRRQTATRRNGITVTNILDAVGNRLATKRIGTDNSSITLGQASYDVAGRILTETNALNGVTSHSETLDGSGQTVKTITYPDGGTLIETYYQDGSLKKITGTTAHPFKYEYGVESESGTQRSYSKEIKLDAGGDDTSEWTKTYSDMIGRSYKTLFAAASTPYPSVQSFYNNQGQQVKQIDPDGVIMLYQFNAKGETEYTAVDMDTNGVIDFTGIDRITRTVRDATTIDSIDYRRTRTYVWPTTNSNTSLLIDETRVSTDGLQTWRLAFGTSNETHQIYDPANGYHYITNILPDHSYSVNILRYGTNVSLTRYDAGDAQISQTTFMHDAHGRQREVTDARNGTTTYYFNNADQVNGTVSPVPATGQSAQVTTNYVDTSLRIWKSTLPDSTSVTNEFFPTSLLKKIYGSRTYPVEYTYDPQGRMKTMKTWQNFASDSGTATTIWNYDEYRGFLTSKTYADSVGPTYTYTRAGRLMTRSWVRGVTTTYSYNNAGEMANLDYSDFTPDVTYSYDRRGRQTAISQGSVITSLNRSDAGQLLSESYSGGPLNGLAVTNIYDSLFRRATNGVWNGSSWITQGRYGYDSASRLQTASETTNTIAYAYLANSALVEKIFFTNGNNLRMTTTKGYDALDRLTNIISSTNAVAVVSHAYQYNAANQRTRATLADNAYWVYQYDALGQVTSGKKYWSDGTPVAGQQFGYEFDDIGNRKTAASGGDQFGANLRYQNYTANNLNQYTQRTVPGYVNDFGTAKSNATVTVNNQPTYRKAEYFRRELTIDNSSGAIWLSLTNLAVLNDGANPDIITNTTGNVFVPQTPEAFYYDADGNLTNDGRWVLTWDGENHLTSMTSLTTAPSDSKRKLEFTYDWQGRRIQKIVSTWNGSAYVAQSTNRFVYDAWNLIATLNDQLSVVQSFLWGIDLSGSMQGAGGVGGLLSVNDAMSGVHFAAYDGNGNISALVKATNGTVSANYEYNPFGETIRATGLMAKANPFRFSTKFTDEESDFVYYGYRSYNPNNGRWLNRDPLSERGGKNLYVFCGNESVNSFDTLGLAWKVARKGGDRAHAKPESGDTVEDLAKLIHFDNKDYRKWLRPVGPTRMPSSATEAILGCAEFTIPNTVFVDIGPRIQDPWYLRYLDKINATFTFLSAMAQKTGDLYERKGFNVVRTKPATGTDIQNHLGSPNIHAYVFAGHGGSGAINSTEDDAVFPDRYTQYGIQYMGLLACGSALDNTGESLNSYPSNVAVRGKFFGSINNYTALLAIIIGVDEFVFIWTPGTNE